jgi:hypothetical protein
VKEAKAMATLNPFIYGKPVPSEKHIGRRRELRTLFSRLRNGECTAVVGEPHIGKSSLLRCVQDQEIQQEWLGQETTRYILVEMDCHILPHQFGSQDFWRQALTRVQEATPGDEAVCQQMDVIIKNQFGCFTLEGLFKLLGQQGKHVVLLIDEFDSLLTHPNFNSAEFFGGLRSIASRTDSLQLITASRTSMTEMNRRTQEINPLGSPYFNIFGEVVLRPFSEKAMNQLLDQALESSGIRFGEDDQAYIRWLSGGHPYRVQAAASALFDAITDELDGEERYATASEYFYERAAAHFDDLWQHLDDAARTVMVILALVELGGMAQRREFSFGEIERPQRFSPELKRLTKLGLVEKVGKGWQFDPRRLLLWQGERWRVACGGFVWWLADVAIAGTRDIPDFKQWLHDQEARGYLFTRKQWKTLRDWTGKVPTSVVSGTGELARLLLSSILKQRRGHQET